MIRHQTLSIRDEQGIEHSMLIEEFIIIIMYLYCADVDAGNVNGTSVTVLC